MNRKRREQLILNAAVKVFAREGYPQTSVSEIIKEARVARGTFYLYFKSKKNVFSSLLERFLTAVSRDVAKMNSVSDDTDLDLAQRFRLLSNDLVSTVTQNRLLTKIILADSAIPEGELAAKLTLFYEQLATIIRHHVDENIRAGFFRPCNSSVVARCLIGSVKEIVSTWIADEAFELEPTVEGLIDYLLNGLVAIQGLEKEISEEAAAQKPVLRNISNLH